jgi:hypothetical protein
MKLVIMQSSPLSYHLTPLRPKHLPRHPNFEGPRPTFLPHCERQSITASLLVFL